MEERDWKLKLRYGQLTTPYRHYTLMADGVIDRKIEDYDNMPGPAFMGIKIWAATEEDATGILIDVGGHLGFNVTGRIEIYETDPKEPPQDSPSCYQVSFHSYE